MKKRYLIIGTSAAGIAALSTLVTNDPDCEIIAIDKQTYLPYNTCFLAAHLANQKTAQELVLYKSSPLIDSTISFINATVEHIVPHERAVYVSSGQRIPYDTLLLATGARAYLPVDLVDWMSVKGIFTFHTISDVNRIKNYITTHSVKKAIVVGAGFTGLECADALISLGICVDIIERESVAAPRFFNNLAHEWLMSKVVSTSDLCRFYLGQSLVECLVKDGILRGARLHAGAELSGQMIIFALGSVPATELAQQAGLHVAKGIVVNEHLQTSSNDIYAAGDCIVVKDKITNECVLSNTWPDALAQGVVAAYNMLGVVKSYSGVIKSYTTSFRGIAITLAGDISYDRDYSVQTTSTDTLFRILFFDNYNVLKGYILIGDCTSFTLLKKALVTGQAISSLQ